MQLLILCIAVSEYIHSSIFFFLMKSPNIIRNQFPCCMVVFSYPKQLDDMKETLEEAQGMGLAAPQVGVLRRAVVIVDDDENMLELVNPEMAGCKRQKCPNRPPPACAAQPRQNPGFP